MPSHRATVLEKYPNARHQRLVDRSKGGRSLILAEYNGANIGNGKTQTAAWKDAASRVRKAV